MSHRVRLSYLLSCFYVISLESLSYSFIELFVLEHTVTGATFIVFNGALKVKVKTSVVEDGLMVALDEESMKKLKEALHEGKDLSFQCDSERQLPSPQQKSRQHGNQPTQGSCGQEAANEASVVNIKWVNNLREKSNEYVLLFYIGCGLKD